MRKIFAFIVLSLSFLSCSEAQNLLENAKKDAVVIKHSARLKTEFSDKKLTLGSAVFFRIFKEDKDYESGTLELWVKSADAKTYALFKTYAICTFSGGFGTKTKEGDGKTPEGFYDIQPSKINQYSTYHRAFNIGYPNKYERLKGYTGNYIMIHGACCSIGCIAMTDERIEEIWTIGIKAMAAGQASIPVHIFPFRLTNETIETHSDYPNKSFLQELKTGYDFFETHKRPPVVSAQKVKNVTKYTFN
jgi:murein L,D-transpeptidase YafK